MVPIEIPTNSITWKLPAYRGTLYKDGVTNYGSDPDQSKHVGHAGGQAKVGKVSDTRTDLEELNMKMY